MIHFRTLAVSSGSNHGRPPRHRRGPADSPRAALRAVLSAVVLLVSRAAPSAAAPADSPPPVEVVATTGMVADAVREVGGDAVRVKALMGEGVDPHLYKASPGDVRLLTSADVIFYNGLHLEGRMADLLAKLAGRKKVVAVAESLDRSRLMHPPENPGQFDPHVWFDARLWSEILPSVERALAELRPASAAAFASRAAGYRGRLLALHRRATDTLNSLPPGKRLLVTAHDAFGYFGRAYGVEVRGVQGVTTDSEPSLKGLGELADEIVKRGVPTVFAESSVPSRSVASLVEIAAGRGRRVTIGPPLYSDALGPEGTPEGTYVGMVDYNVRVIRDALE